MVGTLVRSSVHVPPDDSRIAYSGYVQISLSGKSASFTRQFGTHDLGVFGPAAQQSGGARITFVTAARFVFVHVTYARRCDPGMFFSLTHTHFPHMLHPFFLYITDSFEQTAPSISMARRVTTVAAAPRRAQTSAG
jgi:hypothetical protein